MMSFKKIIAMGMVAATALTSSAVSMAAAPVAQVYAAEEKETATYDGEWCPTLEFTTELKGNFITVAQYAKKDADAAKPKATYIIEYDGYFSLASFNLKKETYWRVYDETMTAAEAKLVTVPAQSDKVTIKIKDTTASKALDVLDIKIGKSPATLADLEQIEIKVPGMEDYYEISLVDYELGSNGWTIKEADDTAEILSNIARIGGATFQVTYAASKAGIVSPVSAVTKFKVPAAAKAPKVTVDYVNGTYKLPNKSQYTILTVDSEGVITGYLDPASAVAVDSKEKQTLTIDAVFDDAEVKKDENATQAAIYVQVAASGKKFASQPAILKVSKLESASGAATVTGSSVSGDVKVGTTVIAEFAANDGKKAQENDIKVTAKVDIQYSTDNKTWKTLKATKSVVINAKVGDKFYIKQLGDKKAAKFGSLAATVEVVAGK